MTGAGAFGSTLARRPMDERSVRRFPSAATHIKSARDCVAEALACRGASGDVIEVFRLAASELAANVIEHGHSLFWTLAVTVSVDRWTMEVVGGDARPPSNEVLHPESWNVPDADRRGGRGLGIVRALMDGVEVDAVRGLVRVTCWLDRDA
ncbi:MAG TPA: ATP-binding protein [Ilumatobacteraceae bacterium]|nr:ATP-binding protein [Ilumatobacteraceae bacterium]